jgi:hypothetical protein
VAPGCLFILLILSMGSALCRAAGAGAGTPAPAADRSTPKAAAATLDRAIEAADARAIADSFNARTDGQKRLAGAMADLLAASRHLQVAARRKFGESAEPLVADMTMGDELKRIDGATVKQDGDKAELRLPEAIRPMRFVRQEGQWKLDVMDYAGANEAQLPKQVKLLDHVAAVLEKAAKAVAADKYDSPKAARQAIVRQLNRAMEE